MARAHRLLVVVLSFLFISSVVSLSAQTDKQVVSLNGDWEFRQHVEGSGVQQAEWRPAIVPGVVHTDLLRNKAIPDPFYRDNESKLQWIENADWEYRKSFDVKADVLAHKNVELIFEGVDTYAEIYLNGKLVHTADNMFREWRIDAKPNLKVGANELLLVFPSIIKQAAKVAAQDKWHALSKTDDKVYIRKAAYEYGWDWGPRFVTSGIWRPVKLEVWDAARISDFHIRQRDVTAQTAHVTAEVEITAVESGTAKVTVEYTHQGKKAEVSRSVEVHKGVNPVDLPIEIVKPELWYPTGYGPQSMYEFRARITVGKDGDARKLRTGLRSVVLRRDVDQWGRSFEIIVNGIPIFGKGADVIPFDSFPTRVTTEQYRQVLQSAKDANMNMIRHWGGGYYETDEFYEICDELGIMIWQDFMFGNDWQPGTYAFKLDVGAEAEHQLKRLRNHPSIVLWCGNNETEVALNWGGRGQLPPEVKFHMWQDYVSTFSGVIAAQVERLAPETPYWPSSPSADYEDLADGQQSGDMHNWDIWHGMLPLHDYEKFFPRFMTEYGFQSFPEFRSVENFTVPEDRTGITTPVMLAHQKNAAGNQKIHDYMLRDYPEPRDFPAFLYASQILQAEAIKIGAEHLRRQRPRSMGSLYWQLNDCWPVASWASLDYYGRWKALHYYARRFYADLLVSPHSEDGALAVYVVSDKTATTKADLRVRLMTVDGAVLSEKTQAVEVPALSSKAYVRIPMAEFLNTKDVDANKVFAVTDLSVGGKAVSSNVLFFVPTRQAQLPSAKIGTEVKQDGKNYRLTLTSAVLARSVFVDFGGVDAKVSDNFFDIIPGQSVEISVTSTATLAQLQAALKIMSLADAFSKETTPATNVAASK
jgi:beta-mannosidase